MKRMVLLAALVAVVGGWTTAPAHSAKGPLARVTVDQSVLRRHAALARLGGGRPLAPAAAQVASVETFHWADATLGCAAGIVSTGFVFLYRRAKRRPAAA